MEYKTVKKIKAFKVDDDIPENAKFLHADKDYSDAFERDLLFYYEITERVEKPEKQFYPEASC